MANSKHLAKLKKGVGAWNKWRRTHPEIPPDLRGGYFGWASLHRADLYAVDFRAANLQEADLSGADLSGTDFRGANLQRAHLTGSDLFGANLGEANLFEADLSAVDLNGAFLNRVNLSRAQLISTTFANNDLSEVEGLETVQHLGPSTIGIDTIYQSQGKIPLNFLRGAGVPENFIEYMSSLTGNTLEFYSCFISYSTKDQEFADRLHADLQNKGVRCWFAPHNIQAGKKIYEQIDEAIRRHERLLLILSPNSMNSEWVKTEISKARKRETAEKKRVLFPVRLVPIGIIRDWECFDADTGKDSAKEIREYHIPDFSEWKNYDSYKKAFGRLLDDLKSEHPKAA